MSYRIQRINSLIRQEISDLLQLQVKDPRLGNFISLTQVDTSPDLKYTRIYISFLGTEEEKQASLQALAGAAGYFRKELANKLKLRHTPELSFHWDDSIARGDRLLRLIDQVNPETED